MLIGIGIPFVIGLEAEKKLFSAGLKQKELRSIKQHETKPQRYAQQPMLQQPSAAEILFRGMIEAAPDAIVNVSRAGFITLINHQTEALYSL